ncbi:MAG: 50S ribosomal protein L1 [Nitrospirae bacterium]|nr:50S ribosomal protein L1 [Nitrospirota bacterium]
MTDHGKKYRTSREGIDRLKRYPIPEAVEMVTAKKYAKFDETVDLAFRLGIDPRHADQMVRGTVLLPHGTGATVRVLVFAVGEKAEAARQAGADFVGLDDMIEKINGGWVDFDRAVATPDVMGKVGKLGKILGPRGLMPNPKLGTVTPDVGKAVQELKRGKVEFKADKAGNVHVVAGKTSFGKDRLAENVTAVVDAILRAKPAGVKGVYVRNVAVSSTMGPAVRLDVQELAR